MKKLLPSGLVAAAILLVGCYADPTPRGVGEDAALSSVHGQAYVGGHHLGVGSLLGSLPEVDIEIPTGEINLNGNGKFKVVIPTTERFDASVVDMETVTLGDGRGADTRVLRKKNGGLMARLEDEDGDGDLDLVLQFSVQDLVASGDLTESTTELVFEAATYAGPAVRATAPVTPRSLEPKTLLPPSRIETPLRIALLRAAPAVWQEV